MRSRAVITSAKKGNEGIGIYLHWNGELETVLAFLTVARERKFRDLMEDEQYGMARLTGLIHEFTGRYNNSSLGIGIMSELDTDNGDNGTYVIGQNWHIVERWGSGSDSRKTLEELDNEERAYYERVVYSLSI